jgi:hypothetical protein
MKCMEGTQTEEGSKWLKEAEKKEQSKGKQAIEREDQGRQSNKEDRIVDKSTSGRRY